MLIVVHEKQPAHRTGKPVICPKCRHGRICDIPVSSQAQFTQRGKPPPDHGFDRIVVKCPKCGAYISLTIE